MNLIALRRKFREISGRFDLVDATYADIGGSDFYINEGRKFLDRLDETQKSWASAFRFVEIGQFSATFPQCRAIKEVWAASLTEGRWQLEKKNLQDLMEGYLTELPSARETGSPFYYAPCVTRYIPDDALVTDLEAFVGYVEIPSGNAYGYNAILLSVPASEKLMLDIRGLFYSHELVANTDTNFWSEMHPMLLVMAAMRQLEIVNRNTQGVNDWTNAIGTEMKQLGMDLVEELIAETTEMEG